MYSATQRGFRPSKSQLGKSDRSGNALRWLASRDSDSGIRPFECIRLWRYQQQYRGTKENARCRSELKLSIFTAAGRFWKFGASSKRATRISVAFTTL